MRKTLLGAMALVVAVAAIGGCGGRKDADKTTGSADAPITCEPPADTRLSIATGNQTGVYYSLGNAFATQIGPATGGKMTATAAETGASVQNIQLLVAGTHQVAFSLIDTASDAVNGKESFDKPQPIRALARIYDNYTHVIVRSASGINSVADMKGKRISVGSAKSGTEVIALRMLKAAGLDPEKDISPQRLDLTKTVDGMKDGTIDGFFWSGGLPTGGVTDLFTTMKDGAKFIDASPLLPKLQEISPAYSAGKIPAAAYKQAADSPSIVVPNVLLVKEDIDANIACALTKTLLDKKAELVKVNKAAEGIDKAIAGNTTPVQLHRGAAYALGK
jgi:TRAP transporter TAXI family solute receptor